MAETNAVNRFRVPKSIEEESKLLKESFPKSTISVVFFAFCFLFAFHAIKFKDHNRFVRVSFVIYADLKSITELIDTCEPRGDKSFTNQYQKHKPCKFSYKIVSFDDKLYSLEPVIYGAKSED